MKTRLLARRYAKAVIGNTKKDNYQNLLQECKELRYIFLSNEALIQKLRSKFVKQRKKKEILDLIVEQTESGSMWNGFFSTILQKKREVLIVPILDEVEQMLYNSLNTVKMRLFFAREQKSETVEMIKKHYEQELGKKIIIESSYDESIIGGFVAIVGNTHIDGSVKHNLDIFKKSQVV